MFKCEVGVADLQKQIKKCMEIVPSASASPMFSNICINFSDEGLLACATDGDVYFKALIDATHTKCKQAESVMFDGKMLNSIVNAFSCKTVTLWLDGLKMSMSSDKQEMTIMGRPCEDFPMSSDGAGEEVVNISIPAMIFQKLIVGTEWALPAKSIIEKNYFYFRLKETILNCYTTDTKMMAKHAIKTSFDTPCEFILPPKALVKISKHKFEAEDMVTLLVRKDMTMISFDDGSEYRIRTSASSFIDFESKLSPLPDNKVKVSAVLLEKDIKSILPIANENFCAMSIESDIDDGCLVMRAKSGETYSGVVRTKAKDMFGTIEGMYGAKNILDALSSIAAEVNVLQSDKKQLFITAGSENESIVFAFAPIVNKNLM